MRARNWYSSICPDATILKFLVQIDLHLRNYFNVFRDGRVPVPVINTVAHYLLFIEDMRLYVIRCLEVLIT